ncbi:acyl--CoA ligase [Streptomyces apricus]|uniref:Acyl--CoA ligase n=1 Tax=Streptomyces apricus TaxID=1828112 RepID=A0A5A9Z4K2_9ACTN|nr:class I adenylate-forming enzyme family protein [Streptomyces apricus]KAA0912064.1 acyl--CoA ligase [Streptomyces apricus]
MTTARTPHRSAAPPGPWTSNNGLTIRDLVPAADRRAWVAAGHCPDRDLYSLFAAHVRRHPRREAVIDRAGSLDYRTLDRWVRHIAGRLRDAGLDHRDIIAVRLPNGRAAVAAELAVAALGAVALPYPAGPGTRDTLSLLRRSRARGAVLADPADIGLAPHLPDLRAVCAFGPGRPGVHSLCAQSRPLRPRPVDPEAPARILVSSGTESEPKMAAYSHNAVAGGRANYLRALHPGPGPMRNLLLVPLGSSYGSCGSYVTVAALGGTLILQDSHDPATTWDTLTRHRPTHVFAVPTLLRRLAEHPARPGEDVTGLHALVSSCTGLPETTAAACRERFRRPVIAVYGSTDGVNCHTAATGLGPGTGTGRPDPAVTGIRVLDARGRELPPGRTGEICARGPMTPLGYVADPGLDRRLRTPAGWVRTGDRGHLDERGRLHLEGRLAQIIDRGGYSISPAQLDRELGTHPAVAEAVCVPVPDPELGQRVCACVRQVPGGPRLTLADITAYLEDRRGLERRKLPELLLHLTEMPLTPTGKICHRTLTTLATTHHKTRHQR